MQTIPALQVRTELHAIFCLSWRRQGGFGLKSQQYFYLIIKYVKKTPVGSAAAHWGMRGKLSVLIWPVISCVINLLIAEHWSVFSLGWVGGISDSERSYWVSCGGGCDVRQAAHITTHQCSQWRIIPLYWVCCISPKWLFFCVLSDNWSNVLVCVISVSLPACNCLISPPQYLRGLTLKWNDLIRSVGLRILWSFPCNQTYFCLHSLFAHACVPKEA